MLKLKSIPTTVVLMMLLFQPVSALDQTTVIRGGGVEHLNEFFERMSSVLTEEFGARLEYSKQSGQIDRDELIKDELDFLIVDQPISVEEPNSLQFFQFPLVIDAVVLVANLPKVTSDLIPLDGMILGNIYLETITNWRNPAIGLPAEYNLNPYSPINIIHQDPASVNSRTVDAYFKSNSPDWLVRHGELTGMGFPDPEVVMSQDDVLQKLNETTGSIGYLPYSRTIGAGFKTVTLPDYRGQITIPNEATILSGAKSKGWSIGNIINQKIETSPQSQWPLTVTYYVIILRNHEDDVKPRNLIEVFNWYLSKLTLDQTLLNDMIGLPPEINEIIRSEMQALIVVNGIQVMP